MSKNEFKIRELEKISGGVNENGENFVYGPNGEKLALRKRKKTKPSSQQGNNKNTDLLEQMQKNDDKLWEAWMGKK